MAIATGTSILLGSLAGAGATAYSAKKQSSAAKSAARTQSNAAQQAAQRSDDAFKQAMAFERERLGLQQQQYNQARQDMAPYRAIGQGAITSLGALTGTMGAPSGGTVQLRNPAGPQQPMVRIQMPNGGVKLVPSSLVQQVTAQGGQVI